MAELTRIKHLTCAVCGESTRGRQWWNRDTGFGVCPKCIEWLRGRGEPEEALTDLYGKEGIHHSILE